MYSSVATDATAFSHFQFSTFNYAAAYVPEIFVFAAKYVFYPDFVGVNVLFVPGCRGCICGRSSNVWKVSVSKMRFAPAFGKSAGFTRFVIVIGTAEFVGNDLGKSVIARLAEILVFARLGPYGSGTARTYTGWWISLGIESKIRPAEWGDDLRRPSVPPTRSGLQPSGRYVKAHVKTTQGCGTVCTVRASVALKNRRRNSERGYGSPSPPSICQFTVSGPYTVDGGCRGRVSEQMVLSRDGELAADVCGGRAEIPGKLRASLYSPDPRKIETGCPANHCRRFRWNPALYQRFVKVAKCRSDDVAAWLVGKLAGRLKAEFTLKTNPYVKLKFAVGVPDEHAVAVFERAYTH
ncbi:hypothetical protein FQR65_LT19721 [Abscondita terminalis]|nr:hypothetical protein FQR65_LT19721 [Abscondita terminalis]